MIKTIHEMKKINIKFLLVVSTALLLFTNGATYVMLLYKNNEWKNILTGKQMYDGDASVVADALAVHVYYDGDSIQCAQTVRHYSGSETLKKDEKLDKVLRGDKIVMLLSANCASGEVKKLLDLCKNIGRNHLVVVADYAMHLHAELSKCLDKEGYYETDVEHLGMKGSPSQETPVVMLTQNGRVKTSFVVGQQTSEFADGFHDYLLEYFKEKK